MEKIPQDIIGDIAVLKFPFDMKLKEKKKLGKRFLKEHKNVETVLEKAGRFKGRLRKPETIFIAGKNKKQTVHSESGCRFFLDVDEAYFSPRLSAHRKDVCEDVAKKLKNNSNVLVMFAGVAPWPIVLAKILKKEYPQKNVRIISNEINRKANKFAQKNIEMNKVEPYIDIVGGDAKKLPENLAGFDNSHPRFRLLRNPNSGGCLVNRSCPPSTKPDELVKTSSLTLRAKARNNLVKARSLGVPKFDIIIMPRPNLNDTFLKTALKLSKKGTRIYYHGFGKKQDVLDEIKRDVGNKIGRIKIKKAGEIAPYQFRWLASFTVS